jgi:GxxExxY protein
MTENEIGTSVLQHAYAIHTILGPGLLESVYEVVLAHELQSQAMLVERQKAVAIKYKNLRETSLPPGLTGSIMVRRC